MKDRIRKGVCWVLVLGFLSLISSCSTPYRTLPWPHATDSPKQDSKAGEEALGQFISRVRLSPGRPEAHFLLACYYQERGRHQEALESFQKALSVDPGFAKAYNGLGVSYDTLRDYPAAIASYQKALELDPSLDYVYNNLGYSYLLQGKTEEAISSIEKAIALNPQDKRFHNNLGLALALEGNLDEALSEFKQAGEEAVAHYNVARFYQRTGLYTLARFHYDAALTLDPSFTHARLALKTADALARIFKPEHHESAGKGEDMPPEVTEETLSPAPIGLLPAHQGEDALPRVTEETLAASPPIQLFPAHQASVEIGTSVVEGTEPVPRARAGKANGDVKNQPMEQPVEASVDLLPQGVQSLHVEFLVAPEAKGEPQPFFWKDVHVEISNGNGVEGMARRIGGYLKSKGVPVTRLTNSSHFRHTETRIYHQRDAETAAQQVAAQLPLSPEREEQKAFDRPRIKIRLLIGKDLIPYDSILREDSSS